VERANHLWDSPIAAANCTILGICIHKGTNYSMCMSIVSCHAPKHSWLCNGMQPKWFRWKGASLGAFVSPTSTRAIPVLPCL